MYKFIHVYTILPITRLCCVDLSIYFSHKCMQVYYNNFLPHECLKSRFDLKSCSNIYKCVCVCVCVCLCACILQIETFDICQRTGRKLTITTPELHPVPVLSLWYHIGIDFVGPLNPASTQGRLYILTSTVSDYFSKDVHAIPTETKEACVVAGALFKLIMNVCS